MYRFWKSLKKSCTNCCFVLERTLFVQYERIFGVLTVIFSICEEIWKGSCVLFLKEFESISSLLCFVSERIWKNLGDYISCFLKSLKISDPVVFCFWKNLKKSWESGCFFFVFKVWKNFELLGALFFK